MANLEKGSKKLLNAWAFYDWANSVYSLVISSAIFPLFYSAVFEDAGIETIDVFGSAIARTPLITGVTAVAFLMVAIMSPLLSGIADYVGNKKSFMKFFCYLGAASCILLYFFQVSHIWLGLLIYLLGLIGFWGSLVFYNSYLPDVAFKEQQDAVSARGFSMGYFGSVILLLVNLVMVLFAKEGMAIEMMRYSFILVGIWWALFAQYSFKHLPSGNNEKQKVTKDVIFNGFRELKSVYASLSESLKLKRYLGAFFIYSMAVQTVMLVATYFGEQEINWGDDDNAKTMGLISSILLIQLVAVLGAYLTSKLSEKYGNIYTLVIINLIWVGLCVTAFFVYTPNQFYITAGVVGLVMGGIQSLSRSTYSKFLPETNDTTSYFSFYDVAEKIGIVIGMGIFAVIEQVTGSMRNSILFLVLFFVIGVVLLLRVPKDKKS